MEDAIREAFNSGRLAETFTIRELRAICPGWADGTYTNMVSRCTSGDKEGPIRMLPVGGGKYRILHLGLKQIPNGK
jgi:hypothetical protein